jgi:hypothetical protein
MPRQTSGQDAAATAERIAAIPDKLAAIQLSLKPLCNGGLPAIPDEAKAVIADACDSLHAAITDVLEIGRELGAWPALEGDPRVDGVMDLE